MNLYPTAARSKIRRLAAGRLISVTGGAAAYTALNYTVWNTTHSPGMQALSLLLTFGVAGLIGPFGGALGDRFDRRKVMIIAEAVSTVFFAAMAFAHTPMMLILLAFGSALADVPFFTASRAAIPNLVDSPDDISWANSLVTLSFLVSVGLTLTVRGPYQEARHEDHDEHKGLASGIALLWRDRVMRRMTIAWFVFVLGMGMGMVADAALAEQFGAHAIGFAALIACWGTGSVVGSARRSVQRLSIIG